jgi:Cu(I)/Ag(I) efflux system membrane protein CusA/SilA
VPVLMGYFIRGKVLSEHKNPLNRWLTKAYLPLLRGVLNFPKTTLLMALVILLIGLWPINKMGSEFMPPLDEGDIMYMPTTYPGISVGKARELLQQTDKLIMTLPEVKSVLGKIGRADTATDSAPLTMIESFIQLKPQNEWRAGMTSEKIRRELDTLVKFPGVTNAWVMPIKTRIDMLATGIKTPVGIKIAGPQLSEIEKIGQQLELILKDVSGTASVYSERVAGGRYLKIDINRVKAARYGLNISDVQQVIATAIGGVNVTKTVEGLERYPVNVRYQQDVRNSVEQIRLLPIITNNGLHITLGDVSYIGIEDGPPGIKSENARLNGWVYVDIENIDVGRYVDNAKTVVSDKLVLPAGYSIRWSGQYQYMERAKEKLTYVVPLTLGLIVLLLFMNFKNVAMVAIIMGTLPLSLVGSVWLMYLQGFNFSVAVGVGFIALAGVAVEIGVIMLVYLNQAYDELIVQHKSPTRAQLQQAVINGAGLRIRPVMMTALSIILGLLPVLYGTGTGSEVMSRIAAPMVGGMVSAVILALFVLPTVYFMWRKRA